MKVAPPNPEFIAARWTGGPQIPVAIVMHGTVSPDNAGTARAVAHDFATTSVKKSAHYVRDAREVIQCVKDHVIAWHCGYNTGSISYEMCDEQVGPASRWQDDDSRAIVTGSAKDVARLCAAYGIEPRRPSVADLKAKGPHGVYGHNDSRLAFGNTTHTDPRDFPWDDFMRQVKAEYARLTATAPPPAKPAAKPAPTPVTDAAYEAAQRAAKAQKKPRAKAAWQKILDAIAARSSKY